MKNKTHTAGEFQLLTSFEKVRKLLAEKKYIERRQRPLAYWVLPTDRRLPLAFLGLTLNEILAKSFDDLSATAGIGQKKIATLVALLLRAAQDKQPGAENDFDSATNEQLEAWNAAANIDKFNPDTVSGAHWALWQETIRRHGVESIRFGRVAASLQSIPTVIWNTPLGDYLDCTLDELRSRKTHGEKRVLVVLEVFFMMHHMLGGAQPQSHLRFSFKPRFVEPIEAWIQEAILRDEPPTDSEIEQELITPLLAQIEVDLGADVRQLAEGRLGVGSGRESVRSQSRRLGVTRARIYQLIDDTAKVMNVRWPEGRLQINELLRRFWPRTVEQVGEPGQLLYATRDMIFTGSGEEYDENIAEESEAVMA